MAKIKCLLARVLFEVKSKPDVILSGARGQLLAIDSKNRTVRIRRRTGGEEDYEYGDDFDPKKYAPIVGKTVDLELCDFLVIGITPRTEEPEVSSK